MHHELYNMRMGYIAMGTRLQARHNCAGSCGASSSSTSSSSPAFLFPLVSRSSAWAWACARQRVRPTFAPNESPPCHMEETVTANKVIPLQHPCEGVLIGGHGDITQGTTGDHHRPSWHQQKIVSTIDGGEMLGMTLCHQIVSEGRGGAIILSNEQKMQVVADCIEGGAIHQHQKLEWRRHASKCGIATTLGTTLRVGVGHIPCTLMACGANPFKGVLWAQWRAATRNACTTVE